MKWIDTHAHLFSKQFNSDRSEVVERALELGITTIAMPNIDRTTIDDMLETELRFPVCKPMMGLHPCHVDREFEKELYEVENWLNKRTFIAIGEMGTDLFHDKTFWPQQQEAFKIQAEWAKKFELPLIIHCRSSIDETINLLQPLAGTGLTGIFHCFTGTREQLEKVISMGFYIGIGGVVTFKNGGLDDVLPGMDISRLVLETDCPYLAPVPHRGKRNEPAYLGLIGDRVAELLAVQKEELVRITTENAFRVFKLT
ncbi:MAG: TatD family hydrolase [Cyclobacteriaceae bacterium]